MYIFLLVIKCGGKKCVDETGNSTFFRKKINMFYNQKFFRYNGQHNPDN